MTEKLILEAAVCILLVVLSVEDIKEKRLSLTVLSMCIILGAASAMCRNDWNIIRWCFDIIPGISLFVVSWWSREAIGYGDSLLILGLGLIWGAEQAVTIFLFALVLAAVWGGIIMAVRGNGWRLKLPFVPFLLAADIGLLLLS